MAKKRIGIKDVAREAHVSNQTVSRVINNRPDVAPATRQLVQETIKRLGYQPNVMAQNLRKGDSFTLGVIVKNLDFYGHSRLVSEIEKVADQRSYSLLLSLIDTPDSMHPNQYLKNIEAQGVDGIFWIVPHLKEETDVLRNALKSILVPVVTFDLQPQSDISVVSFDNYIGAKMATQHLINQGYHRIGIITGPPKWWSSEQRVQGWNDTLKEAGIQIDTAWYAQGNWTPTSGYRSMKALLNNNPDLEAVFASCDGMALGALKAMQESGKSAPNDVALVGWDNLPETRFYSSALTTIDPLYEKWAQLGMDEMARRIQEEKDSNSSEPQSRIFTPKLIIRESSVKF